MACSLLNLDIDTAVYYAALYNALYHIVFLACVRQAAVVSSKIFIKTFAVWNI